MVIAGYQKKNAVLSDKEKLIVAYHEIGHALVAAKQSQSAPVQKITIIPRTSGALGYTMQVDTGDKYLLTRTELENKIATFTGGRLRKKSSSVKSPPALPMTSNRLPVWPGLWSPATG